MKRGLTRLLARALLSGALTLLPSSGRPSAHASAQTKRSAPAALSSSIAPTVRAAVPVAAQQPDRIAVRAPSRPRRVLLISEDGMHPGLIRNQRLQWHDWLLQRGAYSLHARTIRTASTLPSHASMLSGVDVQEHGLTWNNWRPQRGSIRVPTVLAQAKEHGLQTAAFVGKFKLRHILPAGTVHTFVRPGYYCKKVSEEAARYLESNRPELMFVHFSDPDEAGHAAGWLSSAQLQAARECDRCLGTLVQALQRSGLLEETLILVSADHGGHNHGHSGALVSDLEIPWIAAGPAVQRGFAIPGRISTMDTAATVLHVLGIAPAKAMRGRPVLEIFAD